MTGADTISGTIPGLAARNARARGDAPAIREKARGIWRSWSWAEVDRDAARLAAALAARGLGRGDRVALLSDNRPNLFIATLAVQRLGAVAAPLFQDADADQVGRWLVALAPRMVYAENQEQVDKALGALEACPSIETVIHDRERGLTHYRHPRLVGLRTLMAEGEKAAAPGEPACGPGDAAFVFFSAGTDGASRGVIHGHGGLIARAQAAIAAEGFSGSDTSMAYLSPGWSCHMIATWVVSVATGACVCCPESSDTLLTDLREIAPTRFLGTPRVLDLIRQRVESRMADTGGLGLKLYRAGLARTGEAGGSPGIYGPLVFAPLRDFLGMSRIRSAFAVGDIIDPAVLGFFRAIGVSLHKLYGTTETGYLDALLADARGAAADALGKPLPGSEIALSPEGEILIRSDGMFLGYLGDPEARARAVNAEGWFRSGDSGTKGADGAIVLRDRMSDIGRFADGSPFSPKQVERRLVAQPEIGEAVAVAAGPEGVCALIDIDSAVLGRWADGEGIANNGHSDLAALPEVAAVVGAAVARVNEALARDGLGGHRIARFALLPDPLTPASGLLTPTGKLRRAAVQQRFAAAIAGMAAGRPQAEAPAAEGGLRMIALHEAEPVRGGGTRRVA